MICNQALKTFAQQPTCQKYCPFVWNTLAEMATCKPAKSILMYVGPSHTMHSNLIYKFLVRKVQTMSMLPFPRVSLLIRLTVHLNFSHISRFHGLLSPSLRCCSRIIIPSNNWNTHSPMHSVIFSGENAS
jgi:hypothetical protein